MTNAEFNVWANRFPSTSKAAEALGLDRDTATSLRRGFTRKGNPAPIPRYIELACAAITIGVDNYHGGPVEIGV